MTQYERGCMTGGESISEGPMKRQPTGEDRVRMVAQQVSEPRTANWIASEAEWSHGPTKRVLEHLVDDGILHRDDTGATRHTFQIIVVKHSRRPYAFGTATTPSKTLPNGSPR